jgi:hypothetical protein
MTGTCIFKMRDNSLPGETANERSLRTTGNGILSPADDQPQRLSATFRSTQHADSSHQSRGRKSAGPFVRARDILAVFPLTAAIRVENRGAHRRAPDLYRACFPSARSAPSAVKSLCSKMTQSRFRHFCTQQEGKLTADHADFTDKKKR